MRPKRDWKLTTVHVPAILSQTAHDIAVTMGMTFSYAMGEALEEWVERKLAVGGADLESRIAEARRARAKLHKDAAAGLRFDPNKWMPKPEGGVIE